MPIGKVEIPTNRISKELGEDKIDEAFERVVTCLEDNYVDEAIDDVIDEMKEEAEDEKGGEEE